MYNLLEGVRILDLTRLLPGPYGTQMLADMGAEVVKVEDPWQGDYLRWMAPHLPGTEESSMFWGVNRNKKSIKLNLKTDQGKEILKQLVEKYDVLVEGFRPGVMDKLGLGYETLKQINPRLIMCSISGYGQDGPYRLRAGHDINYTAIGGPLGVTGKDGGPPVVTGVQMADIGGGAMTAVIGVLAAIVKRHNTGRGEYVDVSMMDGVAAWMVMSLMPLQAGEKNVGRGQNTLNGGIPCYDVYPTRDGRHMSLGALEEKFWQGFCEAVGRPDLIKEQFSHDPAVKEEVAAIFKGKTRAEWEEFFADKDVCCEPVLEPAEVPEHPQVKHRGLLRDMPHPAGAKTKVLSNPIKFGDSTESADQLPPGFGEHTEEVLKEVGVTPAQLDELRAQGII